jgi:hypothetical protein
MGASVTAAITNRSPSSRDRGLHVLNGDRLGATVGERVGGVGIVGPVKSRMKQADCEMSVL